MTSIKSSSEDCCRPMKPTPLELLSPARDLDCGMAAIDHGADAVYIGADRFGARASAGNSCEDIARLADYAHVYGAKVYVTVNTIIYDRELEATESLLHKLKTAGVDAVIVQDMAVMEMCRRIGMCVHASTQTDNRTAEKVAWLARCGAERVVLARELGLQEIAEIHQALPATELEAFVHGALCVSYSGRCYASQYCFNRSANRGACAQFCRLAFSLQDADGRTVVEDKHLLSLKDMNRIDCLEDMAEAGVVSFKIEGRLKDVAYVKNVTAAYSERLNELVERNPERYCRASIGRCQYTFRPNLDKTFNRGFTTYFISDSEIASMDTPKARGEYVGRVKEIRGRSFNVAGVSSFANGDGLCFLDAAQRLVGFRVNRVEGNRLFPQRMPKELHPGALLYRNSDQAFEQQLSRPSSERKIDVWMRLDVTEDGYALSMGLTERKVEVRVEKVCPHDAAEKDPTENIKKQLTKLGGTPYVCRKVWVEEGFNGFIPSGRLAQLRRDAVECMARQRIPGMGEDCHQEKTLVQEEPFLPEEVKRQGYFNNISNAEARSFYARQGLRDIVPAYELQPEKGAVLMQCRHCLRRELGYCSRESHARIPWREPLHLVMGDGRRFRLSFDCVRCLMKVVSLPVLLLLFLLPLSLASCYHQPTNTPDAWSMSEAQYDSISFYTAHHYTQNFNFIVRRDSLRLSCQSPDELPFDSVTVYQGDHVVVADIMTMPGDTIDSIWVKLARDQASQGWIRENAMLPFVEPDDPISQFICMFSDTHLLVSLALGVLFIGAWCLWRLRRRHAYLVHVRDISSFYPTLLVITVSVSATLYSSIQLFGAESWRHFYYHPSLNPFSLPMHLALFISSVWSIIIIAIASIEETVSRLPLGDALLYLLGLLTICAVDYVVFSVMTLYYVGYVFLPFYVFYAVRTYFRSHPLSCCGRCGARLSHKGRCPECGAMNI